MNEVKGVIKVERHYLGKPNRYDVYDPPKGWLTGMKRELKRMAEEKKRNFPEKKY